MAYKCVRCGSEFDNITNLKSHLARKNQCKPILLDIKVEDIIIDNCKTGEIYECTYCNNTFSTNFNLEKHLKICKKNTNNLLDKSSIKYLRQQIKEKDKQIKQMKKQFKEQLKQINEKDKQIEQLIQKVGNTNIV
jgi:hypothetical protein